MKKVELRNLIKEALARENGYAPNSREIDINVASASGHVVSFTVGGVPYTITEGRLEKVVRESALEKKLKERIERAGGLCLKWTSPGFSGVPDRIVLLPGARILFVEVKRPGTKDGMSPRQKRVADLIRRLGFTVIRLSDMEGIEPYLGEGVSK